MVEIWYAALNILVLFAAIVAAFLAFYHKHPVRDSILYFVAGVGIYAFKIFQGLQEGSCNLTEGFINLLLSIEVCSDTYSYFALFAQASILGAVITWMCLCWQPVMRKIEKEAEESAQKN